tara:strand:- start:1887 stop:2201 length:315 start_codon:yes stop_codon:yes gene_type:complete
MPTFRFKNEETGEEFDEFFTTNNAKHEMLSEHPNIRQLPSMFSISGGTGDRIKNDNGWNEVLSKAAEGNPGTPIADRYGKPSSKEIKTRQIVKKHMDQQNKGKK